MGRTKFNGTARRLFLERLAETASPSEAAAAAGITRRRAYEVRAAEPEFAAAWEKAIDEGLDRLLEEGFRRAVRGVEEPVVHMGQLSTDADGRPVTVRKYSDRLLEVLLKWRYPEKMAERLGVKIEGALGLEADALLRMSAEERAALKEILAKYQQREPAGG